MPWNLPNLAPPAPSSPAPAPQTLAPPSSGFNWNATLPGNSPAGGGGRDDTGSSGGGGSGGGQVTTEMTPGGLVVKKGGVIDIEATKLANEQFRDLVAAEHNKVLEQQGSEALAVSRATQLGNELYQKGILNMYAQQLIETRQAREAQGAQNIFNLESQRANAFNQNMAQFERSGVATQNRVAGLQAQRQPMPASFYATQLGISENDPRVRTIAAASQALFGSGGFMAPSGVGSQAIGAQATGAPATGASAAGGGLGGGLTTATPGAPTAQPIAQGMNAPQYAQFVSGFAQPTTQGARVNG